MDATGRPIIGIAPDISEPKPGRPRLECGLTYARAVAAAGGQPVMLAPIVDLIGQYLHLCDGFVLTGGDDPDMHMFGEPTHSKATPMHPLRQEFDVALIRAIAERREVPVLGICLGMQLLALCSGGKLNQYMPDTLTTAGQHYHDRVHPVVEVSAGPSGLRLSGEVTSYHKQAVVDAGSLQILAKSDDGVIEAVARPDAAFCLGVQWHPERTRDRAMGPEIFEALVRAARERSAARRG